jgi:hypothetical protein
MKTKKTRQQAEHYLFSLWENGTVPPNFTESHSEYERAVIQVMQLGYLILSDFF